MKKIIAIVLTLVLLLTCVTGCGNKEAEFPNKDITLICPFGAGGGTDALARKLADIVTSQTGTNVVVVNKTGGSGAVGMAEGVAAKPDGYTVTMTTVEVVLLPCSGLASFAPTDFKGIIRVNFDAAALMVKKDNPANTLAEFVENAKTTKTNINVSAFPTNYWLCGSMLADVSGVDFNLVEEPNGAAQEVQNLLGGHVDAIICTLAEADQYIASGDFKALAVADEARNPNYKDVPTFKEAGYDIVVGTWRGFMVPKDTPADVVATLDKMFTDAYNTQDFKDFLTTMKFGDGYLNSADFAKLVEDQYAAYKPVIEKFGK